MKSKLSVRLIITLILSCYSTVFVNGQDFVVDGIPYKVTSSTKLEVGVTSYNGWSSAGSWCVNEDFKGDIIVPETVNYGNRTFTVTSICDFAFNGSYKLTSISIPETVSAIGAYAFAGCTSLTSLKIPKSVRSIGKEPLEGATNVEKIIIEDLSLWCSVDFKVWSYPTYLGRKLFLNDTEIIDLQIPSDITSINNGAFRGCSSFRTINIPDDIKTIGDYAFDNCNNVITIVFGKGLQDANGLGKLESVSKLYFYGTTPPSINFSFTSLQRALIDVYVPKGCVDVYRQNIDFKSFANILEMDEVSEIKDIKVEPFSNKKHTMKYMDGKQIIIEHNKKKYTLTGMGM